MFDLRMTKGITNYSGKKSNKYAINPILRELA